MAAEILERSVENITCDAYNDDPVRVRRVLRVMPPKEAFDDASVVLKAIAEPVRARILYAISVEPLCVCELATLLDMSMPAVSHHLKILSLSGLLRVQKQGKFACYYIKDDQVSETLSMLLNGSSEGPM